MNLVRETVADAAIGVGIATSPDGLSAIHRPGCAAVILQRQPDPSFQAWIDRLDPLYLPKARIMVRPDRLLEALKYIFEKSAIPEGAERSAWIKEITELGEIFAQQMKAPYLRLRIDIITTNACRRFHIDAVTARLVCTYRGTGTQYGISPEGKEPSRIFTVSAGSPIVLRGTLWPETPRSGLLHRSPPIEGTGETRSVLVLDPIYDLEDEV